MKKVIVSLCIMLALIGYPCAPSAAHSKAGALVTTPLLGASIGILAGAMVAAFAGSSDAGPILIGAGVGLGLGFLLALFTPAEEGQAQAAPEQQGGPPENLQPAAP